MLDTREVHTKTGFPHHMETLAAIQEGMASAERGELKPAAQVLDEMRAKYGLSR